MIYPIPSSIQQQDEYILQKAREGYLFQTDAVDYFLFTKRTLPWKQIANVVIGRPCYDNYLVSFVLDHQQEISVIDSTNSS